MSASSSRTTPPGGTSARAAPPPSWTLPLPAGGQWLEVFNADAYDDRPPGGGLWTDIPGNPGGIHGNGPPRGDCPTSARIVLPANGFLVFARDRGD